MLRKGVSMQHVHKTLGVLTLLIICNLVSGCGGLNRDIVLQPLAPVLEDQEAQLVMERGGSWRVEIGDAELRVFSVRLSSKTTWVFGPFIAFPTLGLGENVSEEGSLQIGLKVSAETETSVAFDPNEFTVLLEDGRSLTPSAIRVRDKETLEPTPVEPIILSGRLIWIRLEYDESVAGLQPFTLRLGALHVNGEAIHIPPISFVRGKSYRST